MVYHEFPKIMGILNITPDSFSDGGLHFSKDSAVRHGLKLLDDGADILDIGGESSRPGAEGISFDEEIERVVPVIEEIKKLKPASMISIDTTKYEVAKAAVDAGAEIINDISGLENDIRLAQLAAEKNLSLILMHMQGTPRIMQNNPQYNDVVLDIFYDLQKKIELAKEIGVSKIIADVGIGFGKTLEHNVRLLNNIDHFNELNVPLLLGISRKSFIGQILGIVDPLNRDIPSVLIHALLLKSKISVIRVHNVELSSTLRKIYLAFNQE